MKIRPLHDRVVVRRKEEETTTAMTRFRLSLKDYLNGPSKSVCCCCCCLQTI